ncbi:MAG TPA: tryptophan--tRNA ligase [bacterium]|nr:tryptophan--tRNA ligase [bacterium]
MKTILTGDRPTGRLHIGHLFGSLLNRAKLQHDYETYIMVADVQALTDNWQNPAKVRDNVYEVVLDNLAAGVDPEKATIFIQSQIPEIAELTVFFSNLVTLARLQRNPTVKTELAQKEEIFKGGVTYGFLGYPISQAADILTFQAEAVPVGQDQEPMLEQAREIAHKFNGIYGQVFPEPQAILSDCPRLKGLDGNAKMGKSLGNAIYIADEPAIIEKKIMAAKTDPAKIRKNDPGHPAVCPVFGYQQLFSSEKIAEIKKTCQSGELGCVDCKKCLAQAVVKYLKPIQARRQEYAKDMKKVKEIVVLGTKKARERAQKTMSEVRQKMMIDY